MLFFWTFYSSKKPEKILLGCFQHNNNNNKCFFEQQIIILGWLLIFWTTESDSNDWRLSFLFRLTETWGAGYYGSESWHDSHCLNCVSEQGKVYFYQFYYAGPQTTRSERTKTSWIWWTAAAPWCVWIVSLIINCCCHLEHPKKQLCQQTNTSVSHNQFIMFCSVKTCFHTVRQSKEHNELTNIHPSRHKTGTQMS